MLEHPSHPQSPPHDIGQGYDFATVRAHLGGETAPPNFLIHRDGAVRGLCLGLMWHPLAEGDPAEVWVGRKGNQATWGLKLAETTGALPVYVRREEGGKWIYMGLFEVTGSTADPAAIRLRLKPPKITVISRVVFLQRFDPARRPPQPEAHTEGVPASACAPPVAPPPATAAPRSGVGVGSGVGPESGPAAAPPPPARAARPPRSEPPRSEPPTGAAKAASKAGPPGVFERSPVEGRSHPRDPLHDINLETIVTQLVKRHGWAEMGARIPVRCFLVNPSLKSSLTFLRKTPWAREKIEDWFIEERRRPRPPRTTRG